LYYKLHNNKKTVKHKIWTFDVFKVFLNLKPSFFRTNFPSLLRPKCNRRQLDFTLFAGTRGLSNHSSRTKKFWLWPSFALALKILTSHPSLTGTIYQYGKSIENQLTENTVKKSVVIYLKVKIISLVFE